MKLETHNPFEHCRKLQNYHRMTYDNLRQELVLGREGISARLEKKTAL